MKRSILLSGLLALTLSVGAQTHQQGIEYYKADQLNNAQELLLRNLNNSGTDKALSYYYLGQIEMRQNKIKDAKNYFDKGIAENANCPYNYVGLGYIALKDGDLKTAEKYFKDAESRGKKDMSVQIDIARAYYDTDKVLYKDKYEKIIETALKKDGKNPDTYILQGDVLRDMAYATQDAKLYGSAATKYDMAKNYDPTSAVAYVKYADMYTNAQNPTYAIAILEELINSNPQSALGQRQLANAYYETGQFSKAAAQYGNYVKNPNHFKSDEDRYSFILFYDGKYQEGYDYATKLLSENPDNFSAMRYQFMNAAQIPALQGNLLGYAEKLLASHKANPENKFAPIDYTLIAEELASDSRPADAVALLEEAMTVFPENASFNNSLAKIYLDNEDYGKTADAYKGYVDKTKNPGYNEYLQLALYSYFGGLQNKNDFLDKETGEVLKEKDEAAAAKYYDMATEYASKAAAANESQYRPHKVLGDIAKDNAEPDKIGFAAAPEYQIAVDLIGENPDARAVNDAKNMYSYLSVYYYESGDSDKAKEYIQKAIALDPENATYKKIAESYN